MQQVTHEIAISIRRLLAAPAFTAFAAITLALGIGATTAIYSVIYTAVLRPLDITDVDRVVNIYHSDPVGSLPMHALSVPDYEDLRRAQRSFSAITAWSRFRQAVFAAGSAEYLIGEMVGGEYFQVLGADRASIMRMMIADGFRPVALGIVAGLGFGALARVAMRPIFVRLLPAIDAGALIGVPVFFIMFALVACYFPARRAARVDPSVALRNL